MNLRRLLHMSPGELATRGRQELTKRLDHLGVSRMPPARDTQGALVRLRREPDTWFFTGAVEAAVSGLIASEIPEARERVLRAAEEVCASRFDLLGYRGLSFGDPVDWFLDPVSGRTAPTRHWSRLHPLDAAEVGDSKVTWELNRHQWLVRVAQAYRFTGEERYAQLVAHQVEAWMRANPYGVGINWASSLEVAYRLIAWCWALVLLGRAATLSDDFYGRAIGTLWAHAHHVERYLSRYFSPNTHLTGEALGLVYAGALFSGCSEGRRWRALGEAVLTAEAKRQIHADGVYFEQSTCYQRYTADIYLHWIILAGRSGRHVPRFVRDGVCRMLDFMLAVRRPDGSMPSIGDADGGRLLPLDIAAESDFGALFSTAAALFRRADYAWAAATVSAETVWLLGAEGRASLVALGRDAPGGFPSRAFRRGGYVVMRSDWGADAHQIVLDAGPLGCSVSGAHGHADLLSVQAVFGGEPFLVDAGTGGYTGDLEWRQYFRSTIAHSTVLVDGAGQAAPRGPFSWALRPHATLRRADLNQAVEIAEGQHEAYGVPPGSVRHRRRLIFARAPGLAVVVDDVEGEGEHDVQVRFQFAPLRVSVDPSSWARATSPRGQSLFVRSFAATTLKAEVFEGDLAPKQGWISTAYGTRRPAPVLVSGAVVRLPIRVVSVLVPSRAEVGSPPDVCFVPADHPFPRGIEIAGVHLAFESEDPRR